MRTTWLALFAGVFAISALPVAAAEYEIWNTGETRYNWLLDRGVTSSWGLVGGDPTTTGSGHGSVGGIQTSLSSAQRVWIPGATLTGRGTNGYWAEIDLGEVRPIDFLRVQTFTQEMTYSELIVQFSTDGVNYDQQYWIYNDHANPIAAGTTYNLTFENVYDARYVRVVFPAGTYTSTAAGYSEYGGPGLFGIEPYSPKNTDIEINSNFNIALNAFSGHNQVAVGFDVANATNGAVLGDGGMSNSQARAGATAAGWAAGASLTVQLNDVYDVDAVRIVWNDGAHYSRGLMLEFSLDGIVWDKIDPVIVTDDKVLGSGTVPAWIEFEAREAKFVRWTQLSDVPQSGYAIAQEFMVYAQIPPIPEPATMTLLALGGLALLRRRR
ncbi:MAG: discoidin domain-containing protein [Phycisphaerae bacterium]|nr:discoidin domain-containing protein [Phycisphaerae bacterium]